MHYLTCLRARCLLLKWTESLIRFKIQDVSIRSPGALSSKILLTLAKSLAEVWGEALCDCVLFEKWQAIGSTKIHRCLLNKDKPTDVTWFIFFAQHVSNVIHVIQRKTLNRNICVSYIYWTVHHLDSWIKTDQLMSLALFFAQRVSNASTFIIRSLRLCVGILLWFDVCWRYGVVRLGWCGILMQAEALPQPA